MANCSNCKTTLKDGAKFCVKCGTKVVAAATGSGSGSGAGCAKCGSTLKAGAKFCVKCGTPVAAATPKPAQTQTQTAAQPKPVQQTQPAAAQPQTQTAPKPKVNLSGKDKEWFDLIKDGFIDLSGVPENERSTALCLATFYFWKSNENWSKIKRNLSFIPDKSKTYELCLAAVSDAEGLLEDFKTAFPKGILTAKFYHAAVKANCYILEYVPYDMRTYEMCLNAVKGNSYMIEYVPTHLRTPELYRIYKEYFN